MGGIGASDSGEGEVVFTLTATMPSDSPCGVSPSTVTTGGAYAVIKVDLIYAPAYICVNESASIRATIEPHSRTLVWGIQSDSTGGASVSQDGIFTAGPHEGSVAVKLADSEADWCSQSVTISVIDDIPDGSGQMAYCITRPVQCTIANELANDALLWAQNNFPAGSLHNGVGDAARHAYWNCLMTRDPDLGEAFAEGLATAHENDNLAEGSPCIETAMDLINNEVGRELGSRQCNSSAEQCCENDVIEAVNNGELTIIENGQLAPSN